MFFFFWRREFRKKAAESEKAHKDILGRSWRENANSTPPMWLLESRNSRALCTYIYYFDRRNGVGVNGVAEMGEQQLLSRAQNMLLPTPSLVFL